MGFGKICDKCCNTSCELNGDSVANLLVNVPFVVTVENIIIREGLKAGIFPVRETAQTAGTNAPEFKVGAGIADKRAVFSIFLLTFRMNMALRPAPNGCGVYGWKGFIKGAERMSIGASS